MKNSLLLQLIEKMDRKQMRELGKYVQSPFLNQRQDVIALYQYLWDCYWHYSIEPTKGKAFAAMYRGEEYDDHKVRMAMSFLHKTTEKYLAITDLLNNETEYKTRLARIYKRQNLPKHFDRSVRQVYLFQENTPFRNADFFNNRYLIQLEQYEYAAAQKRTGALNLHEVNENLDIAFMAQKLRQTCLSIAHQTVYKTTYDFGILEPLLKYIEQRELLHIPVISIYYHCYFAHTETENSAAYFYSFKELIFKHASLFPEPEVRDLYLLAINYCVKCYNAGDPAFLKDQLELYQAGLEQRVLLKNGIISRFTYRNTVTLGLILNEYGWVESFIYEYKNALDMIYQESMFSFCLALLEYHRKQYDKALQLLQKSEYTDLLLNLSTKTVLLKIYYELMEYDLLEAHIEAMKTFLRRKKIMGYHKENYTNLLKFTQKLLEIPPFDTEGKRLLRQEIKNRGAIAERSWLLDQLEGLL